MKIVVLGLGYVGLSNAVLLAQHNQVIGVDTSIDRVDALNARKSPIADSELSYYLTEKKLNLTATTDLEGSVVGADYVIIATPTNYNETTNFFDTSSVLSCISAVIKVEPQTCLVVKSTIPVGFIDDVKNRFGFDNIFFSPEFLSEGRSLHDNLYPSRIIVGEKSKRAKVFADLMLAGAKKREIDVLLMGAREAEAVKLFANSHLAMRVAFFNELDTYAMHNGMDSREIISGICLDPRIGNYYNNPSFGYGGYCLPKDSKQLLANYGELPQNIISAIIESNSTRIEYLANLIIQSRPKCVGIFRLIMKAGSDNFRESSTQKIMERITLQGIPVVLYEPQLSDETFNNVSVEKDIEVFKCRASLILANRVTPELSSVSHKVFSRDLFNEL